MKVSIKDVAQWIARRKQKKQPHDLNSKELDEAAKDLKVAKHLLARLIRATHFDSANVEAPAKRNKLHGDITGDAVTVNPGRNVYQFK